MTCLDYCCGCCLWPTWCCHYHHNHWAIINIIHHHHCHHCAFNITIAILTPHHHSDVNTTNNTDTMSFPGLSCYHHNCDNFGIIAIVAKTMNATATASLRPSTAINTILLFLHHNFSPFLPMQYLLSDFLFFFDKSVLPLA